MGSGVFLLAIGRLRSLWIVGAGVGFVLVGAGADWEVRVGVGAETEMDSSCAGTISSSIGVNVSILMSRVVVAPNDEATDSVGVTIGVIACVAEGVVIDMTIAADNSMTSS